MLSMIATGRPQGFELLENQPRSVHQRDGVDRLPARRATPRRQAQLSPAGPTLRAHIQHEQRLRTSPWALCSSRVELADARVATSPHQRTRQPGHRPAPIELEKPRPGSSSGRSRDGVNRLESAGLATAVRQAPSPRRQAAPVACGGPYGGKGPLLESAVFRHHSLDSGSISTGATALPTAWGRRKGGKGGAKEMYEEWWR